MSDETTQTNGKRRNDKSYRTGKSTLYEVRRQRAVNESISTLLSVVQYLNRLQDGDALRIDQTYSKTEMETRTRILNCHEQDIMNASLITMKRLIETLLPLPTRAKLNGHDGDQDS